MGILCVEHMSFQGSRPKIPPPPVATRQWMTWPLSANYLVFSLTFVVQFEPLLYRCDGAQHWQPIHSTLDVGCRTKLIRQHLGNSCDLILWRNDQGNHTCPISAKETKRASSDGSHCKYNCPAIVLWRKFENSSSFLLQVQWVWSSGFQKRFRHQIGLHFCTQFLICTQRGQSNLTRSGLVDLDLLLPWQFVCMSFPPTQVERDELVQTATQIHFGFDSVALSVTSNLSRSKIQIKTLKTTRSKPKHFYIRST